MTIQTINQFTPAIIVSTVAFAVKDVNGEIINYPFALTQKIAEFYQDIYNWSGVDEYHPVYDLLTLSVKTDADVDTFIELYDGDYNNLSTTCYKLLDVKFPVAV